MEDLLTRLIQPEISNFIISVLLTIIGLIIVMIGFNNQFTKNKSDLVNPIIDEDLLHDSPLEIIGISIMVVSIIWFIILIYQLI